MFSATRKYLYIPASLNLSTAISKKKNQFHCTSFGQFLVEVPQSAGAETEPIKPLFKWSKINSLLR